jgi:antirestriction protein ArdC
MSSPRARSHRGRPEPRRVEDGNADDGKRTIPLLKTFHVFHATDIQGLPAYKPPSQEDGPWTRPESVSVILKNSGVELKTGGDRAFYSPQFDFIQMPPDVAFPKPEYWSATAVHELNHATGHPSRMNRDLSGK